MRKLIDQQQAAERIQNKLNEVFQYPKTEYAEGYVNACNAVLKMFDSLPAADAAPVVHGKWIHHLWDFGGETVECTACHTEGMIVGNYCPHCGARMEDSDE